MTKTHLQRLCILTFRQKHTRLNFIGTESLSLSMWLKVRQNVRETAETTLVNEGDFILFNSEDVHLVRPVVGTSVRLGVHSAFVWIYAECSASQLSALFLILSVSPQTKPEAYEVLQEIAETNPNDEYSTLLQIAHVNKIYYLLLKNCTCFKRATNNPIIPRRDFSYAKTAIAYINENYKREIPLNEISSVVNLSPSYFSKYFKSITRVSIFGVSCKPPTWKCNQRYAW